MIDVTHLIQAASEGQEGAADKLLAAVYEELRDLARAKLERESPGQTLQATALVHEAWLRLRSDDPVDWKTRGYFFAACAEAMRRILVERARGKGRLKRGGGRNREELDSEVAIQLPTSIDLLALDEALDKLAAEDPRKARLVELRYFTGMTLQEAALALSISVATADRDWAFAKAFLYSEIKKGD